jgi:hypothetical protein
MPSSMEAAAVGVVRPGWTTGLLLSVRENSLLLVLVAVSLAGADGLAALQGRPERAFDQLGPSLAVHAAVCFAVLAIAFVPWVLHTSLVRNISIQSADFWRRTLSEFVSRDRILLALPILAAWPVLALSFSQIKSLIPAVMPYYLDPLLDTADRAIHFGQEPWALLQPLLGHPTVTYIIDRLYALWFFVMYFGLLLQIASTRDKRLRMHFLLSSILAWLLLGAVAATLLSSAGPCYFGKMIGSPDAYAPLMEYLRGTVQHAELNFFGYRFTPELIAVRVQDLLWDRYQQGDLGIGSGISAAPSLHVASTWLIARMLQTYGRWPAVAGWGFFAVVLIGSVHLGWHYAVDGYIAIAGAWALWRLTGWLLNRRAIQAFLWPRGLVRL